MAAAAASVPALAGTFSGYRPRTFEHLAVTVTASDALWVGTLGFVAADGSERWEDLYGFGALDYHAPRDFDVHRSVSELRTPVRFVAAPMAGHDPANPLTATLSTEGQDLASGTVDGGDDAVSIRLE